MIHAENRRSAVRKIRGMAYALTYDHAVWFFGTALEPCRFGYTLGYQIAGRWLDKAGAVDAATWVNVPAATVLAMGLQLSAEG